MKTEAIDRDPWRKPDMTEGKFQRHYGHDHATVLKWEWSGTFSRWTALVRFADGDERFTWIEATTPATKEVRA